MAWLSGYGYRKTFPLNGTVDGAQSNYPMMLTVHKGVGADSAGHVYLNNHCRDDFNDIRFTTSNGTTEIDHGRERYVSGDYAVFAIEFDSIPESPDHADFYSYYDNPSASSGSNMAATWEDFEQFDNLNAWAASAGKTKMHTDATHVFLGSYAAMKDELDSDTIEKDYGSALTGRRVRWWFYDDGETDAPYADVCGFFDDTPDFCVIGRRDVTSTTHYMYRIAGVWTATAVARSTGWHLAEFLIWAADDIDGYIDGTKIFDSANINGMQKPAAGCWWGQNGDYWVGAFCVGKLANPEPTWGTWGAEEAAPGVGRAHGYIMG